MMEAPVLPPLLNALPARAPFEEAIDKVRAGKAGAGDVFFGNGDFNARLAIVLEPDVSAARALEMAPLAMAALGESVSVLVPPQVAVQFRKPLKLVVNSGVAGGIKTAVSKTARDEDIPGWLVIGVETGLKRSAGLPEPGRQPDITTLDEEGCGNLDNKRFIETFARHFLSWLAIWQEDGFAPVARLWKLMAEDKAEPDMGVIRAVTACYDSRATAGSQAARE